MRNSVSGRCVNKQTTQRRTEASCEELAVARESANALNWENPEAG